MSSVFFPKLSSVGLNGEIKIKCSKKENGFWNQADLCGFLVLPSKVRFCMAL